MSTYLHRRELALARGIATAFPIDVAHAENAELRSHDGRRFIDFTSGIGVTNLGHRHPAVVEAVTDQLGRFAHVAFQVLGYPEYLEVAERLNALCPCRSPARAVLFSTGAEAIENAVKLARAATGRADLIAFDDAFHGRSFMALSLTGKVNPYKSKVGPLAPGVHRMPFPAQGPAAAEACAAALQTLFETQVAPTDVAAVIIEPIQGEGGFNVASFEALRYIRQVCDRHGIVLIADEIQSGFGRTGRMFAIEHAGVQCDLVTVAKGLAGGLPLSAVVGDEKIMNAVAPGGLGGTFGGNPLSCAAALAVLRTFEKQDVLQRARQIGDMIRRDVEALSRELPGRFGVRGLGAMVAVDFEGSAPPDPNGPTATKVQKEAFDKGLLILTCGRSNNAVRFLPPLTIGDDELAKGLRIFCEVVRRLAKKAQCGK